MKIHEGRFLRKKLIFSHWMWPHLKLPCVLSQYQQSCFINSEKLYLSLSTTLQLPVRHHPYNNLYNICHNTKHTIIQKWHFCLIISHPHITSYLPSSFLSIFFAGDWCTDMNGAPPQAISNTFVSLSRATILRDSHE